MLIIGFGSKLKVGGGGGLDISKIKTSQKKRSLVYIFKFAKK